MAKEKNTMIAAPSQSLQYALIRANDIARHYNAEYVTTEVLIMAILENNEIGDLLKSHNVDVDGYKSSLDEYIDSQIPKSQDGEPKETKSLERVLSRAFGQSIFYSQKEVGCIDILDSMLHEQTGWAAVQAKNFGITKKVLAKCLAGANTAGSADCKALRTYCVNVSELAVTNQLDPMLGRENELDQLVHVLSRRTKHNALMIGDPGVGKTAIVEGLAQRVATKQVPDSINKIEIWSLDISSIMAGTKYRGDLEERFKEVVADLSARPNCVLFIDEAHMLNGAGAGQNSNMDLANMLKPGLSRRQFKVIAATTWEDYRKSFEKDRALMRRFNRVMIDEPNRDLCIEILQGILPKYREFHNVSVTAAQLEQCVDLSDKWVNERKQPDKCIDLLDAAMTRSRLKRVRKLDSDEILQELSKITKLPIEVFKHSDKEHTINIETIETSIKDRVFGQNHAVEQVMERIAISRAGLKSPNRPVAQFLFLGPTGVGKTELAKTLSDSMGIHFAKFDMSEYQEKHSVAKLIGAPPGYVGYEDANLGGGLLISAVEKNPHCVLLLDEIEKADPQVSNVLLQIMDSGWITSSNGKRVDCRNCIVILTSNLGAAQAERPGLGFVHQSRDDEEKATKEFFAPEFRNRLDAVIKFRKLDRENIRTIAGKFVREINSLIADKNCEVTLTDAAYDLLLEQGYDEKMGARPMGRAIDQLIKVPLSRKLLSMKVTKKKQVFEFDRLGTGLKMM